MRPFAALTLLLVSSSASAHDADIIYAQVQRAPGSTEVSELVTMTAATLTLLAPVDRDRDGIVTDDELSSGADAIRAGIWNELPLEAGGKRCAQKTAVSRFRETYVELVATFDCAEGELVQTFRVLSILPRNYKVVLGTFVNGEAGQRFAQGNEQKLVLDEPKRGASGLFNWVKLGVEHIFLGPDHLAFLLALLLTAKTLKRVLLMVTSFTLAHSITLGLAATGKIPISEAQARLVEIGIAVSIIWVAVENVALKDQKHRPFLTFAFGLVHGFGFATSLEGYGIERELVTALFGFNAGVELGQGVVVLIATPLLFLLRKRVNDVLLVRAASLIIAAAGGYWLVDRFVG